MKILLAHNYYQALGGEGVVFHTEARLLENLGHQVVRYSRHNRDIEEMGGLEKIGVAACTFWSRRTYREIRELIQLERPDVAHFHNTFPLISPSAYSACAREGVPVVQTLHNYRLLCPKAELYRDGEVCEDCLGRRFAWSGFRHHCYRESRLQTALVAGMVSCHRGLGTWRKKVDLYITPTRFSRSRFIAGGFPPDRIVVKPNTLDLTSRPKRGSGDYALFVGRLAENKGLDTLLDAWDLLTGIPLLIIGDGPMAAGMKERIASAGARDVRLLGALPHEEVIEAIQGARFVVVPSTLYETFGLVVIEAYACGIPVVASRIGALAEIVTDGKTGALVHPGDAADLAKKCRSLWDAPGAALEMGSNARSEFDLRYSPDKNISALLELYRGLLRGKSGTP